MRLLGAIRQAGGDPDDVFRRGNLPWKAGQMPDAISSMSTEELYVAGSCAAITLANMATEQDGRPLYRAQDWFLFCSCTISAMTLREALQRGSLFLMAIDGRCGEMELSVFGEIAELAFSCRQRSAGLATLAVDTFGMMNMHGLFSWLIGHRLPITRIRLPYPAEMRGFLPRGVLPCDPEFGFDRTTFTFPANFLDYPVLRSQEEAADRVSFTFMLDGQNEGISPALVDRVRRFMYEELNATGLLPSVEDLSAKVGLNRETFRRRLRNHGTSYSQVKESCRRELGLSLLRRSSLSIEEVAGRLGFCDSDAFRRSFREWTGMSPTQYRQHHAA